MLQLKIVNYDRELIERVGAQVIARLANETRSLWREEAKNNLGRTADRYADNIHVKVNKARRSAEVILDDPLSVKQERGSPPYDLKPALLRGRSHRIVPLEIEEDTRGRGGQSRIPERVADRFRKRGIIDRKRFQLEKPFRSSSGYLHQTLPYEGLTRSKTSIGGSTFKVFRRVSTKSHPASFIHPGFAPRHFARRVVNKMRARYGK